MDAKVNTMDAKKLFKYSFYLMPEASHVYRTIVDEKNSTPAGSNGSPVPLFLQTYHPSGIQKMKFKQSLSINY